jgi:hypothetical protein
MPRWVVTIGVAAAIAAAAVAWLVLRSPENGVPAAPIRLDSVGAVVFHVDTSAITRRGPPRMIVVRLDGPVELVPHHYRGAAVGEPRPIGDWADVLEAPILFNAGQFDEKLDHLGWLKADGNWIALHRKKKWMGLLVSGPIDGEPWAGVIDLEHASSDIAERYRHVIQSMMLVDDDGKVRVRDSDRSACRTVVGQDRKGRILIMVTEGAVTLADLARWLPKSGLGVVRAMNLDGGIEAQLAVRTPALQMAIYGQYGTGTTVFDGGPGEIRYPLPTVIEVRPVTPR